MATRKSRSVNNKRFGKIYSESPDKDGGSGGNKNRQRKRKLTDMLGSQWSKEELNRFYEAYRKYGKDWKKVASVVRNRSTEMVEALYNMNRAYLSLPEGMASAAGLTAMMTDHYSILDGSESDRESDDAPGISQKPAKRARGKYQVNGSKGTDADVPDLLKFPPLSSNNGCFSVKKRRTSGGRRAVGKRTPRYAVSRTSDKHEHEKFVTPNGRGLKSDLDVHDEEVAHGAALTLAEALQRGGSPQVSQTPTRRSEHLRSSSARNSERNRQHDWHGASTTKRSGVTDENYVEVSGVSMEVENGDFDRDASDMMDTGGVGTVVIQTKGNKSLGRKQKYQDTESINDNEVREASSGTEKGLNLSHVKENAGDEVTNSRYGRPRKKTRELKDDEIQALDGLTFLANMSLELGPASESSVQFKEEKGTRSNVDNFGVPENRQRDKSNFSGIKEKSLREAEVTTSKSAKIVRGLTFDVNSLTEGKNPPSQTTTKAQKLKHKPIASKMQSPTNESHTDLVPDDRKKTEVLEENGKKSIIKAKRLGPVAVIPKQGKSFQPPEHSSSSDPLRPGTDAALSTEQVPTLNQVLLPTKHRSRRKMDLQKTLVRRVSNFSEDMGNKRPGKRTSQDGTPDIKEKLSRCLSSPMLRRWCAFEWFYSAIDYPWFAKKEFVEYLNHVGLGHVPRLTRVEWGVIRSSLGKPRRLSQQFLREEKEKLEQYRESVRTHYTELRNGTRDGLPTDLARPLTVGQRVIACHPRTREFHDGSVLTVDRNRCRIQFDQPELGVEFVMDIDCMPLNAFENMPEALRRQNIAAGRPSENLNDPKLNNQSKDRTTGSYKIIAPSAKLDTADVTSQISSPIYPMNTLLKKAEGATISDIAEAKAAANETLKAAYNQPCTLAQIQAREADIRALSELSRALEKKEALVSELSYMNDEVQENQMNGDNSLKDYDPFKKQYATVLIQLKEANDQVSSALQYLRKRNTYQGNSPPWQTSKPGSGVPVGPFNSIDASAFLPQEAAPPPVVGILESSRVKAQTMVDVAVQALLSCKDGGDAFVSIGEALDSASTRQNGTEARSFTSTDLVNSGSFPYQDAATNSYISKPATAVYSNGTKQNNSSFDANEVQIPKDLITSCLATLLMVQTCTERQYPPAEVAQILDSAFTSLHPCCSQNLPIYQQIRMCIGLVKNQILALIPI